MNLGASITLIAAIAAAYLSFRFQQRLKAFEMLLARRQEVLKEIEDLIEDLYSVKAEINSEEKTYTKQYLTKFFHKGLIVFHKSKSANFGKAADSMAETFWSIVQEPLRSHEEIEVEDWVERTLTCLAGLYAFASASMNDEIETLSLPPHRKIGKFLAKASRERAGAKTAYKDAANRL